MQEAINMAFSNPNFYAKCIPFEGEIPTIDEFIRREANRVDKKEII